MYSNLQVMRYAVWYISCVVLLCCRLVSLIFVLLHLLFQKRLYIVSRDRGYLKINEKALQQQLAYISSIQEEKWSDMPCAVSHVRKILFSNAESKT